MSILIQFITDNIVLFVLTIIAVIMLIGTVAALIAFNLIQKRKSKSVEKQPVVSQGYIYEKAVEPDPSVAEESTAKRAATAEKTVASRTVGDVDTQNDDAC